MARVGYARVSTTDQDLDIQIARLKAAGCDIVQTETFSGASHEGRGELETVMQFLRAGDELVVLRLDCLGRSARDVLNLVNDLDAKRATLRVLEPEVTTAGDTGRMVITVLGMVADMELRFIKDRQKAGIEVAKARGVYKGRAKSVDDGEIRRRVASGASKTSIARDLNISRMTVYRALGTPPAKPPSATVILHLTIEGFNKRGRGENRRATGSRQCSRATTPWNRWATANTGSLFPTILIPMVRASTKRLITFRLKYSTLPKATGVLSKPTSARSAVNNDHGKVES